MGIESSIAAMSINMSQASLQNAMNISLMKKTMDQEQANAMQLIESMAAAVPPPSNHIIDVLA
ncbi:MAG: YjfB family protein [Butyricicoccus pullicaecorum]|nr:YjfB family protein [Butyricicoccus pullicaecorum]